MRTRLEDLIEIGVPTNRLGMMLTFSSTHGAGGREGLQPLAEVARRDEVGGTRREAGLVGARHREHLVVGLGVVQSGRQRPR